MKKVSLSTIILVITLIIGVSLLLYPTISNYWNQVHQSKAMVEYAEVVSNMSDDKYERFLTEANEYNKKLAKSSTHWRLSDKELEEYNRLLDISGTGIMGQIEIPKINCSLTVYHDTADEVLQIAVGHIPGSSLPVGGTSTHTVLSGHRGLPSAKIFTHLDQLEKGDLFMIRVLDEVLTYEVDSILIAEPNDFSALGIEQGEDYCTLVTCTPYGVNTHRLLVRGHRIENIKQSLSARVTADAMQIEPLLVATFVGIPILLTMFLLMILSGRKNSSNINIKQKIIKGQ